MIADRIYREHSREFSWYCGEGEIECFRRFGLIKLSAMEKRNIGRKAGGGRPFRCGLPAPFVLHNVNIDGLTLITKITSFELLQNFI